MTTRRNEDALIHGIYACYFAHGREYYEIDVRISTGGAIDLTMRLSNTTAWRSTIGSKWTDGTAYNKGYLMAHECINELNEHIGRDPIETFITNPRSGNRHAHQVFE